MGANGKSLIRENLLSRSGEITRNWFRGVISRRSRKEGPDAVPDEFKEMVDSAIEILTAERFDPLSAREIGRRAAGTRNANPDLLGRSLEILSYEFAKGLSTEDLLLIHPNLSSFMAQFSSGFVQESRKSILREQGKIHESLMQDLLSADRRLRHINEELDAKVRERTYQLETLNTELKRENKIRKMTEERLRERENLLSVAFDSTFIWTGLLDPEGRIILPNRKSVEFLQMEPEDVIGKDFWDSPWWEHSVELKEQVRKAMEEVKQGETRKFDVVHIDPDGNPRDVQFTLRPVRNEEGEVIFIIPEGMDITERKESERKLRKARDEMKMFLENTSDILFSVNSRGILTYLSPQIGRFGYDSDASIGKDVRMLLDALHPNDREEVLKRIESRFRDLDETPMTYRLLDTEGNVHWLEEGIRVVPDENGGVLAINGVLRDITERKKVEDELNRLKELLTLTGRVMHDDIENNLSSVGGVMELMKEKGDHDPDLINKVAESVRCSLETLRRMNDLEKIIRNERVRKECSVREVISSVTGDLPIESNIKGNCSIMDEGAFGPVMENLVYSALLNRGAGRMDFLITSDEGNCIIEMRDDGDDIPEASKERLSDGSFPDDGTCLGIFMLRSVIEWYGGEVSVNDNSPRGALITLMIPRG